MYFIWLSLIQPTFVEYSGGDPGMTRTACLAARRDQGCLLRSRIPQPVGTMPLLHTKTALTFHRQKTRRASSSSPPRTLPMRIHSEMRMGPPAVCSLWSGVQCKVAIRTFLLEVPGTRLDFEYKELESSHAGASV